ncbi:MAG: DUF3501 family protein [Pseudomonadota bacterium]|jgi:hypothetical protein
MSRKQKRITPDDLMPLAEYQKARKERREKILQIKQHRRIEVGPYAAFYFENYDTMLQQVQEMLYIEKGGEAQIEDELSAYNPLIPQGEELVCTLLLEVEDPNRRDRILRTLSYIENHIFMQIGSDRIPAVILPGEDRTREDGKTSSVHFLRFPFTPAQIAAFRDPAQSVSLGIAHENYAHIAPLSQASRETLAGDFDMA